MHPIMTPEEMANQIQVVKWIISGLLAVATLLSLALTLRLWLNNRRKF